MHFGLNLCQTKQLQLFRAFILILFVGSVIEEVGAPFLVATIVSSNLTTAALLRT